MKGTITLQWQIRRRKSKLNTERGKAGVLKVKWKSYKSLYVRKRSVQNLAVNWGFICYEGSPNHISLLVSEGSSGTSANERSAGPTSHLGAGSDGSRSSCSYCPWGWGEGSPHVAIQRAWIQHLHCTKTQLTRILEQWMIIEAEIQTSSTCGGKQCYVWMAAKLF